MDSMNVPHPDSSFSERQTNQLKTVNSSVQEVSQQVKDLSERIGRMDLQGTQHDQIGYQATQGVLASNERRTLAVEKAVSEVGPKVERIDTNLGWITQWIQAQEAAKRHP
jgi:hypothetical protein